MSVLIRGMEMPLSCWHSCTIKKVTIMGEVYCPLINKYIEKGEIGTRHPDCPLVEIPTPHGVLKDTTAFDERIRNQYCKNCERRFGIKNGKRKEVYEIGGVPCRACDIGDMLDWLDDAPTVIEAEGSEE